MGTFELTDAQLAENQTHFREANERLKGVAEKLRMEVGVPFLCECPDLGCTEIVPLALTEYESIRSSPVRFFTAPGHAPIRNGYARLVRETERFVLVENEGVAATTSTALDPRAS